MLTSPYIHTSEVQRYCRDWRKGELCGKLVTHGVTKVVTRDDGSMTVSVHYCCGEHVLERQLAQ